MGNDRCRFKSRAGLKAGVAVAAWLAGLAVAQAQAQGLARVQVPVVAAQAQPVAAGLSFTGVIEAVRQSTLSAQATGRIASLAVKAGDRVRAAQVLATIDDRDTQAGLARARAGLAQADAEWRNAESNARRMRELKNKGFISQSALDSSETQLKAAAAARQQAGAGAQQSHLAQGFTRLSAPYDGVVLQTLAEAGDLAVPGKPVLSLYAPRPLRATVQLPLSQGEAARAARGVLVGVTDAQGQVQWLAPVGQHLLAAADPVAQTLEWRLTLPDGVALLPGQQAQVRLDGATAPRMVVPAAAILRRGELTAVYVALDDGFALKAVRAGAALDGGVEVLAGLSAGDRVAVDAVRAGLTGARPAPAAAHVTPAAQAAANASAAPR